MHGFLSEILVETLQTPIETFLQLFWEKRIMFSDIFLLIDGEIMSSCAKYDYITHQNIQSTMFKHSKRFNFRSEKYSKTWTEYK